MHPKELKYSLEHIWLKDEGNCQFRLGFTYRYQEQIKSLVYLELPPVGHELKHGEPFGAIESSKVSTDLISPVDGVVSAVNTALVGKPGLVNRDPYGEGWLMLVQLPDTGAVSNLLSADQYLAAASNEADTGPCQT